jgi:hypothetical protein
MSLGLELILSTALVTTPAACSWAHPGANPYRGDPLRALRDFDLPESTRRKLRVLMVAHATTDVATITRDDIAGAHAYTDLREMHSGRGQVCHGAVDRSAWSPTRRERGLVYCADDACVIVPTICNNVSLVTRRPEREAALDEGPIDIEPAAGQPPTPVDTPVAEHPEALPPGDFLPMPEGGDEAPGAPAAPGGGGPAGGWPIGDFPGGGVPIGGGAPCCGSVPIGPGSPGGPPVTSPVPDAPAWALLLAGMALIGLRLRRVDHGRP